MLVEDFDFALRDHTSNVLLRQAAQLLRRTESQGLRPGMNLICAPGLNTHPGQVFFLWHLGLVFLTHHGKLTTSESSCNTVDGQKTFLFKFVQTWVPLMLVGPLASTPGVLLHPLL